jgi:endonuclease YncB( thermonuclease family)
MGNSCVRNLGGITVDTTRRSRDVQIVEDVNTINLKDITWKDTKPFVAPVEEAYVIKVYDGDTITVATVFSWDPKVAYRFSVRILGIDTPEKRTKDDDEKYVAEVAQKFVADRILNTFVTLQNVSTDKYGRLLANVFTESGESIGDELIKNNLAVTYDGGTKKTPDNWKTFYLVNAVKEKLMDD